MTQDTKQKEDPSTTVHERLFANAMIKNVSKKLSSDKPKKIGSPKNTHSNKDISKSIDAIFY